METKLVTYSVLTATTATLLTSCIVPRRPVAYGPRPAYGTARAVDNQI